MAGSSSWRSTSTVTKENEVQYCETICSMLRMLSCSEKNQAYTALLAMTNSPESCQSLRRAGCIPLLIQILHPGSIPPESHPSTETKSRASKALKNIVLFNPDEKMKRKELRVLRLLESIRAFSTACNQFEPDRVHPTNSTTALMKLSFDDEHKNTMCTFGAVHVLADLIISDHKSHGPTPTDADCNLIRRYSCMTLTNLTLGDGINKALLCSMSELLNVLVAQLQTENEDLVQVTASVFRNLSWHAAESARDSLRDSHAVSALMNVVLRVKMEPTLKPTLSALWNLSAHSPENKAAICSTQNALKFLVNLMKSNKSMTIVENAGGLLRNVSQYAAQKDEFRKILRECHCFEILLGQLRSSSLTVVSNACGTLSYLSAKEEEQRKLLDLNAAPMLKSLRYSKHDKISQGANQVLRNIMAYYEQANELRQSYDPTSSSEQPLDLSIASCKSSPIRKFNTPPFLNPPITFNGSVTSTRSCPDIQLKQQQQQQQQQQKQQQQQPKLEGSTDETFNYSHYDDEEEEEEDMEEEEKHQQKDTVKTYCDEGTPGFAGSMVDLSNQAMDTFIQFRVEDTPAGVLSRTSSLSSIGENQHGENRAEKILGDEKPMINNNSGNSNNNSVGNSGSHSVSVLKRVTFPAEETPLMFSRCSSVASLESCGDLNTGRESDCVSEFSRRTSEAVSPSDLPDSPRAGIIRPSNNNNNNNNNQNNHKPVREEDPNEDVDFIETDERDNKPSNSSGAATTTTDELKFFAIEGTPAFISTATSLSDIVAEFDNSMDNTPLMLTIGEPSKASLQQHQQQEELNNGQIGVNIPRSTTPPLPPPSSSLSTITMSTNITTATNVQQQQSMATISQNPPQQQPQSSSSIPNTTELEAEEDEDDDPIYSDVQLLQKCIKAGRAVSLAKKVEIPEDEGEIDLSNLIQRGRAKLITKSENNLRQCTSSSSSSSTTVTTSKNNQNVNNINVNVNNNNHTNNNNNSSINGKIGNSVCNLQTTEAPSSSSHLHHKYGTGSLTSLTQNLPMNTNSSQLYQNQRIQSERNLNEKPPIEFITTSVSQMSLSPSRDSPPSETSTSTERSSSNKNIRMVMDENIPTAEVAVTIDSNQISGKEINSEKQIRGANEQEQVQQQQKLVPTVQNNLNPPSLSTFGSGHPQPFPRQNKPMINQNIPMDFNTQKNSNNNNGDDEILLSSVSSSQFPKYSRLVQEPSNSDSTAKTINVPIINHTNNIPLTTTTSTNTSSSPSLSSQSPKFDTFSIKKGEQNSPKDRRKNNPERYLTRTIEKCDLKMKPMVPPKPNSSSLSSSSTSPSSAPSSSTMATASSLSSTAVRPTRASELRASHSREHSPTNSTQSLNTAKTTSRKIPPKPPVRSTPPLNTTLPRNAKLMEGKNLSIYQHDLKSSFQQQQQQQPPSSSSSSNEQSLQQNQLAAPVAISVEAPSQKFGFARIGNLWRKSFNKDSEKWGKKKDNVWVKRREKALVSPFNYKPPMNEEHFVNGNNSSGHHSNSHRTSSSLDDNVMIVSNVNNVPSNHTTSSFPVSPPSLPVPAISTTNTTTFSVVTTTTKNNNNSSNGPGNGMSSNKITTV